MSRYNVTYKPGGTIQKDVGMTIKMVKKQAKQEACPDGVCVSPPLAAVWLDCSWLADALPVADTIIIVPGGVSLYLADDYSGGRQVLVMASMVNADWFTNGIAGFIDMNIYNVSLGCEFTSIDIPWFDGEIEHLAYSTAKYSYFGHQLAAVITLYDYSGLVGNELIGILTVTPYLTDPNTLEVTALPDIVAEVRAPQPG